MSASALTVAPDAAIRAKRRTYDALRQLGAPRIVALFLAFHDVEPPKWNAPGRPFLYLWGESGTGKTIAAARLLLAAGAGSFVDARSLIAGRKASFAEDGPPDPVSALLAEPLVVLDDLGAELQESDGDPRSASRNAFARDVIDDLLRSRHADLRRTIITSNVAPKDLGSKWGVRLESRIYELALVLPEFKKDHRAADRGKWLAKLPPETEGWR